MTLHDISAAIFDIDGTLLDSSPVWDDLGERFLKSRGVVPKPGLAEIPARRWNGWGCCRCSPG